MLLEQRTARLARQKGFKGMTRLYSSYHTTIGSHHDLILGFLERGCFIQTTLTKEKEFKTTAIRLQDSEVLYEITDKDYTDSMNAVFILLLSDLKNDPKMRMV